MEDRVIKYFDGGLPTVKRASFTGDLSVGVVLDVETTGLNHAEHEITELGFVKFIYDKSNFHPLGIEGTYDFLNQPKVPLTEEITRITGITNEMLEGHKFNVSEIEKHFKDVDIVIAHNSSFDKKFVIKVFTSLATKVWGCSKDDIPWKERGCDCRVLQHLCNDNGFYYKGHRASTDASATYKLLECADDEGITNMAWLISRATLPEFLVEAAGFPFEAKDELKAIGFYWNAAAKVWAKTVSEHDLGDCRVALLEISTKQPRVTKINPLKRFL